jgi:hypothetical protein
LSIISLSVDQSLALEAKLIIQTAGSDFILFSHKVLQWPPKPPLSPSDAGEQQNDHSQRFGTLRVRESKAS